MRVAVMEARPAARRALLRHPKNGGRGGRGGRCVGAWAREVGLRRMGKGKGKGRGIASDQGAAQDWGGERDRPAQERLGLAVPGPAPSAGERGAREATTRRERRTKQIPPPSPPAGSEPGAQLPTGARRSRAAAARVVGNGKGHSAPFPPPLLISKEWGGGKVYAKRVLTVLLLLLPCLSSLGYGGELGWEVGTVS